MIRTTVAVLIATVALSAQSSPQAPSTAEETIKQAIPPHQQRYERIIAKCTALMKNSSPLSVSDQELVEACPNLQAASKRLRAQYEGWQKLQITVDECRHPKANAEPNPMCPMHEKTLAALNEELLDVAKNELEIQKKEAAKKNEQLDKKK